MSDSVNPTDIDFETFEIYRGDTPEDIEQRCLKLCKDYLGGAWLNTSRNNMVFKRLSGGFTNQLYYCSLPSDIKPIGDEPREVAIRIYCEKHYNAENDRLSEVAIAILMSENNLGPKVYGVFEGGQIIEYIKHHQFRKEDQKNPSLVKELARLSARTHALNVPMNRTNIIFKTLDHFYEEAHKKFPFDQWIDECNCETLKKYPLKKEIEWIKKVVAESNSPLTFSHNDFRGCNVMVREDLDQTNTTSPKLVVCDFEYSSYSYRGIDFGTIFLEWGRGYNDFMDAHIFPDDSVLKQFVNYYIDESVKVYGTEYLADKNNSVSQLVIELKVFTLFAYLFIILFSMRMDENFSGKYINRKLQMPFYEKMLNNYINLKQFIDEIAVNR